MLAVPKSVATTYFETGLWRAARETLAMQLYEQVQGKEPGPRYWARPDDVQDHYRLKAQQIMLGKVPQ